MYHNFLKDTFRIEIKITTTGVNKLHMLYLQEVNFHSKTLANNQVVGTIPLALYSSEDALFAMMPLDPLMQRWHAKWQDSTKL